MLSLNRLLSRAPFHLLVSELAEMVRLWNSSGALPSATVLPAALR
jgi:hypothetical protein